MSDNHGAPERLASQLPIKDSTLSIFISIIILPGYMRSGGGFIWGGKVVQNPLERIELSGITRRWTSFSVALMVILSTTLNENDAKAKRGGTEADEKA